MRVFKFGGSGIKDADSIKNVAEILKRYKDEKLAIVVSAKGKTTNALEQVVEAHVNKTGKAMELFEAIKQDHLGLMRELFEDSHEIFTTINDTLVEAEWILDDEPEENYDYAYDQIVCIGELLSTNIVAAYLNQAGLPTQWLDARDIIFTDNNYREGWVIWDKTKEQTQKHVPPIIESGKFVLTQGFIGSTTENFTTTLGREGSDYTAAIISHCIDAEDMTIWKDVPGVLNADPRIFENTIKLDRLSYREAIEMTYYGAQVIHPKTIKPLQNKSIPLYVKSFIDPDGAGTEIASDVEENYPPIIVVEKQQTLLHISTKDYSFVAEHHMARLFERLADLRIFVNSMQNNAISFSICVTLLGDRVDQFVSAISDEFRVKREDDLELITIRHYTEETIQSLKKGKIVLSEERIRNTIQMAVRSIPLVKRREKEL